MKKKKQKPVKPKPEPITRVYILDIPMPTGEVYRVPVYNHPTLGSPIVRH